MKTLNSIMLEDDDLTANYLHEALIIEMNIAKALVVALDGMDAIDKLHGLCILENHCPELIFLDINMPRIDGFEFLQKFNES